MRRRSSKTWPALLLLGGSLLLSGCGLFGGKAEEDPPAELLKFKPSLQLRKAWSAKVGDGSEHLRLGLVPATDGTWIYAAAHDGRVAAFDAATGKRGWTSKTRLPLSAGPGTDGELVVAGSSNGEVVALRATDGKRRWVARVSSEVLAAPAVGAGLVLVRGVDGKLTALRQDDGSEAWFVQQSVPRLSVRGTGAPVVAGNVVLAGFDNGKIAAYEVSDGTLLWETLLTPPAGRTEVDRLVDINATPRVVGEDLYAVGYHGNVAALALESGQILWARELSSYNEFALDFLNIYVTTETSELVAVSRRNGREAWRVATLLNRDVSGPAAWKNSVVAGDFEGYLHWFNAANGELQARMRAGSTRIAVAPIVVGDLIIAQSEDGKLYAFGERDKR